ncbi:MAG: prolyl oligopeptidase family serine peptidase [Corynebacterium sp.]|uniref:prolyl oligopeptidase family serine peptidase n=1 Tax=Corynebacterium sp. TaxID=1720 RepID=UPI0026DC2224|nr:prolyl oligopeptidase family serine peptidase [Corynebacterium sp.]MDO5030940.1 prolyl oligopeptidase family serine peptidase [Corynebacterium sp.]
MGNDFSFLATDLVPDWLDDIEGAQALAWARAHSDATVKNIDSLDDDPSERTDLEHKILAALNTDSRIAYPVRRGDYLYNFWRDAEHPRGLWRRTSLDSYLAGTEDSRATEWETVIDLDALAAAEEENWVWKGTVCRYPDFDRALILLSRGGADATVVREFDLTTCSFVDKDAFYLPEAKSDVCWVDRDEILVGSDFGEGSLTDSGYPRQVRRWRRGMPSQSADVIFSGHQDDVAVGGWFDATEGFERLFVERAHDFYNSQRFVSAERMGKLKSQQGAEFSLQILEVPQDCRTSVHRQWLVLMPRTEFNGIPAGGVAVVELDKWLAGSREVEIIFTPDAHTSFQQLAWTKNYLVLTLLEDVATKLVVLKIGSWESVEALTQLPTQATVSVIDTSSDRDDEIWLVATSALEPATLWYGQVDGELTAVRRAPALFDSAGMETRQHWAISADGTRIPYRITGRFKDSDGVTTTAPTLVHAYGGFEVSLVPQYSAIRGLTWLSRGGYFVEANLRGGGEFGPKWHSSVVKTERMRVYEDHQAVLRDLVDRGYCTPDQLGVRGGSNGGLLTAVCLTLYPELVGAVVSQVPLADMMRYHTLSAGASWMAEYGDPDNASERAAITQYSPVQRVVKHDQRAYPPALITTSTRDDRVHPAHARSLAWLLAEAGQPVDYYENTEGGHAGAADNSQVAFVEALISTWLWHKLK